MADEESQELNNAARLSQYDRSPITVSVKPMGTSNSISVPFVIDERTSAPVAAHGTASKMAIVDELMRSVGGALGEKTGGTAALFMDPIDEANSRLAKVVLAMLE